MKKNILVNIKKFRNYRKTRKRNKTIKKTDNIR